MKPDVQCETSKGRIEIVLQPAWSPKGVARFLELVRDNYFDNMPLFRCVHNFLCQFGYKEEEPGFTEWPTIADDPRGGKTPKRFKRGYISFAGNGQDSRNSHLFVTLGKNVGSLGQEPWETPLGYVTDDSMRDVVSSWTTKYGDMPPWGKGPDPGSIARSGGKEYLKTNFPDLDYIISCKVVEGDDENKDAASLEVLEKAPPQVTLELGPNLGRVVIQLERAWSPKGVQRFLEMIDVTYLDEARFFRVIPGFVVQFGLPADPKRANEFPAITDDPVKSSNVKGTITFATSGPNTRTTQLFINLGNNERLDTMGFSPIGRVIEGMEFVERINSKYGEQPNQGMITNHGNEYLDKNFPGLSYVKTGRRAGTISGQDVGSQVLGQPDEPITASIEARNVDPRALPIEASQIFVFCGIALALFIAYISVVRKVLNRNAVKTS